MKTAVIFSLLFFAIACKKESVNQESIEVCGVSDPIHNLAWLNAKFKNLEGGSDLNGLVLYTYEGKEVIEIQSAVYSSTNVHQYYCDGTALDLSDGDAFYKFKSERIEIGLLYGTKIW